MGAERMPSQNLLPKLLPIEFALLLLHHFPHPSRFSVPTVSTLTIIGVTFEIVHKIFILSKRQFCLRHFSWPSNWLQISFVRKERFEQLTNK